MFEKYPLLNEPGKTLFVFKKSGEYYGHIVKDRTETKSATFVFVTPRFESIDALKAEYPPAISEERTG